MHRLKGHKLLSDGEADEKDRAIAGESYSVRYLGSIEIPNSKGRGITDDAVNQIYSRYSNKAKFKSLTTKELFVSANCVSIREPNEGAVLLKYSTVNVTFCNTNEEYQNAFVFVGRGGPLLPLNAHVVHCASAAKANEIFTVMSQAFLVRSSLYKAKQIERAGWASGTHRGLKAENEEALSLVRDKNNNKENNNQQRFKHENTGEDLNNNGSTTFGDFACAIPQQGFSIGNGHTIENGFVHENDSKYANNNNNNCTSSLLPDTQAESRGNDFPQLANMLLGIQLSRGRSHSWHNPPYVESKTNGVSGMKRDWPNGMVNHAGKTANEDDDFDAFSTFALERSAHTGSLVHLVS